MNRITVSDADTVVHGVIVELILVESDIHNHGGGCVDLDIAE